MYVPLFCLMKWPRGSDPVTRLHECASDALYERHCMFLSLDGMSVVKRNGKAFAVDESDHPVLKGTFRDCCWIVLDHVFEHDLGFPPPGRGTTRKELKRRLVKAVRREGRRLARGSFRTFRERRARIRALDCFADSISSRRLFFGDKPIPPFSTTLCDVWIYSAFDLRPRQIEADDSRTTNLDCILACTAKC